MPSIKVQLSEETERRFREAAMKRFGYGKGALSSAAEKALSDWADSQGALKEASVKMGDPVEAIEGLMAHVRKSSVAMQHEASKARAGRALTHAARRR